MNNRNQQFFSSHPHTIYATPPNSIPIMNPRSSNGNHSKKEVIRVCTESPPPVPGSYPKPESRIHQQPGGKRQRPHDGLPPNLEAKRRCNQNDGQNPVRHSQRIENYQKTISDLQRENARLRETNQIIELKLEKYIQHSERSSQMLENSQQSLNMLATKIKLYKSGLADSQENCERITKSWDRVSIELKSARTEVEKLQSQKDQLHRKYQNSAQQAKHQSEKYNQEVANNQELQEELRRKLQGARTANKSFAAQIKNMEQQVKHDRDQTGVLKSELDQLQNSNSGLRKEIAELRYVEEQVSDGKVCDDINLIAHQVSNWAGLYFRGTKAGMHGTYQARKCISLIINSPRSREAQTILPSPCGNGVYAWNTVELPAPSFVRGNHIGTVGRYIWGQNSRRRQ